MVYCKHFVNSAVITLIVVVGQVAALLPLVPQLGLEISVDPS